MIVEVFNLLPAVLTPLGAVAAVVVLIVTHSPLIAVLTAVPAILGSPCWVVAAVAALIEQKRQP
jgi:hypothetical protein